MSVQSFLKMREATMDIIRAKELLTMLADGVNPLTGEVLSDEDSCNQVEIVRNDITNMQVDAIVNTANPKAVGLADRHPLVQQLLAGKPLKNRNFMPKSFEHLKNCTKSSRFIVNFHNPPYIQLCMVTKDCEF